MVILANKSHFNDIKRLWKISFGDDFNYVDRFLFTFFKHEKCLLWQEADEIVAMLHLLPALYVKDDIKYQAGYIYAACTLPNFRGKGIMARLIAFTAENYKNNFSFLFLLPSQESLYDYYGRLNYKTVFFQDSFLIGRKELIEIADNEKISCKNISNQEIQKLRLKNFNNSILWSDVMLENVLSEWRSLGGEILGAGGGYALCFQDNNKVLIKEFCAPNGFRQLAAALINKYDKNNFEFRAPKDYIFSAEIKTSTVKHGMAYILNENTDLFTKSSSEPYANLLMD